MIVKDSLVHEVDVTRFLFEEEIASVQILRPTPNPAARDGLEDPQIAIFRTTSGRHVDVELFVTTGVGYEVRTEIVGEHGSATIGAGRITSGFREHFGTAYDVELQRWVDACAPREYHGVSTSTARRRGTATRRRPCARPVCSHSRAASPSQSTSPRTALTTQK